MQKLLLVSGSVAVCLLSGCGTTTTTTTTTTATTSCKLSDGDKHIDCADISTACCKAHHEVAHISAKERAISVKDTVATNKKDVAKLLLLEKDIAVAVAARGKACKKADNAAAEKCYNKTDSGPAAEMIAEVPPSMAGLASSWECEVGQPTGGSCGFFGSEAKGGCDYDRGDHCDAERGCICSDEACVVDHETEKKQRTPFQVLRWEEAQPLKVCRSKQLLEEAHNEAKTTTTKDDIHEAAELAQLNNRAFAGLAGFLAGGVVMVTVVKVRTSSKHTEENSF